jgi:hypothetical protein
MLLYVLKILIFFISDHFGENFEMGKHNYMYFPNFFMNENNEFF